MNGLNSLIERKVQVELKNIALYSLKKFKHCKVANKG